MAVSEKKRASNDKYNAKCDSILIRPLKPIGEKIRMSAKASGKSLQGYILDAVTKQIEEEECGTELPAQLIPSAIEWLKEKKHTDEEILDFINAISEKQ